MDQHVLQSKINRFWDWFQQSEHQFREVADPRAAVEAMDNHVLEFGMFSWEIGQGNAKPHYLLISPNGDGKRLEISYKIMKSAPNLRHWEFLYCKPPANWDYKFEMYDQYLVSRRIDASEWEYVAQQMPNGFVEIFVHAENMENIDQEDKLNAVESALVKILGEELFIDHLGALEVVHEFTPDQERRCQNMRTLRRSFERFIGQGR